jgi:hypothetical protein
MAKFPAKIGPCIDKAYLLREERQEKQREFDAIIEEMKKAEKALADHIVNTFKKSEINGAKGDICSASWSPVVFPKVTDWTAVYAWVKKTGAFEIFEKRISKSAFKERYEAKEFIPGVEAHEDFTLSLTKISKK